MFAFFAAAGAAAAMYYFDPESGGRRRALLRDKFAWLRDEFGDVREAADGRMEHMSNVAKGLAHETGIARVMPKRDESNKTQTTAMNSRTNNQETHEARAA